MSRKCFHVWDESISGLKTMYNCARFFRSRPVRNQSNCTSFHYPIALLARYSLFGGFLLLVSSVSLAQDPATVGKWSAVTPSPYVAAHAHVLPTGKVLWSPQFGKGDSPVLLGSLDKHE